MYLCYNKVIIHKKKGGKTYDLHKTKSLGAKYCTDGRMPSQ